MTALITLFVHVIDHPTEPSSTHDLALMEVAVGFFGRLEYVTSGEAGFTQTTEFVRQARFVVDRFAQNPCHCGSKGADQALNLSPTRAAIVNERSKGIHGQLGNLQTHGVSSFPSGIISSSTIHESYNLEALGCEEIDRFGNLDDIDGESFEECLAAVHTDVPLPQFGSVSQDSWLNLWLTQGGTTAPIIGDCC